MIGTIVNVIAIIIGSLIGILFNKFIPKRVKEIIFQALGLSTILIGMQLALKTENVLLVIFSLIIGGIIGELIHIEKKLKKFGISLKKKLKSKDSKFVEGFVTTSLLFCVGAMAIVGSIEDGINNNPSILLTKSLLDGFASIAFASALGFGVMFSAIPILIYQGGLTLLAVYIKQYLTPSAITEMSAVGGLLIIGIGLSLLNIKKIKIGNLLPSVLVAAILAIIFM
ncbi:DUF554 domain-containing protein [archaeon]|jgi:uncharacterized protein|nr:DUF554 domain-containing protein [archaeon]MBT4352166.1 DUF554 domain-containing protein [archaeon]MBT4648199.1 DUF554 domain-containing protein [archaeon]MBT6822249.1 DUF554 domain-containing protein [archaeon]MBT7392623.1 DUF554 domain-containing protein [archaeon]